MNKNENSVADKWRHALKGSGYEHHVGGRSDCRKLKKFARVWRKIFKAINLTLRSPSSLSVFEFGCGGGTHLVRFALNGWKCVGIDCSEEVLKRAENHTKEVSAACGVELDVELIHGDFLEYVPDDSQKFDIVFHVGVIEHFLDDKERLAALKKMFDLVKTGGFVISIVPSGVHVLRQKMRQKGLGGYFIPEIDYSPEIMTEEFEKCGGKEIQILPHNIFAYLIFEDANKFVKLLKRAVYYFFQLVPIRFLPSAFVLKHTTGLIGIAQKPKL